MPSSLVIAGAKLAQSFIREHGGLVTLERVTPGAYDELTATRAADTTETATVKAVIRVYTPNVAAKMGESFEANSAVRSKGKVFEIAGLDAPWKIEAGQHITMPDGTRYHLDTVVEENPDGTYVALYRAPGTMVGVTS